MQDLSQKPSKGQQSQRTKGFLSILTGQAEFSKKMAILDTIYYIVFIIIVITLAALYQPFAGICPELVTILTTGLVTLRLGYTVKAGTENWKKISQNIRDTKENFTDSLDEGSSEEETEEEENG